MTTASAIAAGVCPCRPLALGRQLSPCCHKAFPHARRNVFSAAGGVNGIRLRVESAQSGAHRRCFREIHQVPYSMALARRIPPSCARTQSYRKLETWLIRFGVTSMSLATLLRDIESVITVYEGEIGVSATRTRQMIERHGAVEALSRLAESADLQKGFRILRDRGQLESTFETLIVRHQDLFRRNVVEAAQWRLNNATIL